MAFRLTDSQWTAIAPLVARPPRLETRGRKRRSDRDILNGVLWMLEKEHSWRQLGSHDVPPFQTCHRRCSEWLESGALLRAVEALARDLEERGRVRLQECFFDDWFTPGYEKEIFLMDHEITLGDVDENWEHWSVRTANFFKSPHVWMVLTHVASPWMQQRLPSDLARRAAHLGAH